MWRSIFTQWLATPLTTAASRIYNSKPLYLNTPSCACRYTLDFRMYPNNSYNSIAYSFTGNSIENGNEAAFFQNTICCGVFISNLHELLQHHEEFHDEDAMEFALVDEDNEWDEDDDLIMVMELDEDEAQDNIKVDGSEAALDDGSMSGALAMMLPAMGKSSPTSPVTLPCNDKVKDFRRKNSAKQAHNFTDQSKRSSVSHAIPVQLTLPRSHNGKG